MARQLPPKIWFVRRSNKGNSFTPVTRDGWRVVLTFLVGMAASGILGYLLQTTEPTWLWIAVMAGGMALSGVYFLVVGYRHADLSITYDEYVKDQTNA